MGSNLSVAVPGHTVGHTMVRVSSGDNELLIWGDIVHNAALQFPEPDRSIAFDHDPAMAIANRKKVSTWLRTTGFSSLEAICVSGAWPRGQSFVRVHLCAVATRRAPVASTG